MLSSGHQLLQVSVMDNIFTIVKNKARGIARIGTQRTKQNSHFRVLKSGKGNIKIFCPTYPGL